MFWSYIDLHIQFATSPSFVIDVAIRIAISLLQLVCMIMLNSDYSVTNDI